MERWRRSCWFDKGPRNQVPQLAANWLSTGNKSKVNPHHWFNHGLDGRYKNAWTRVEFGLNSNPTWYGRFSPGSSCFSFNMGLPWSLAGEKERLPFGQTVKSSKSITSGPITLPKQPQVQRLWTRRSWSEIFNLVPLCFIIKSWRWPQRIVHEEVRNTLMKLPPTFDRVLGLA